MNLHEDEDAKQRQYKEVQKMKVRAFRANMYTANADTGALDIPLSRSRRTPVGSIYTHLADPLIITLYETLQSKTHPYCDPGVPASLFQCQW
jgi:hypothetical protein